MKKYNVIILIILLFGQVNLFAKNTDSLKVVLKNAKPNEEVEVLKELISAYNFKKVDSAFLYINKILERKNIKKDPNNYIYALNTKGINLWGISKFDSALYYLDIAETQIPNITDSSLIARVYQYKAIVYNGLSEYALALEYFKYENNYISENDLSSKIRIWQNIGTVYLNINSWDNATKYIFMANKSLEELQDSSLLIMSYYLLASIHFETQSYAESKIYYDKSIEMSDRLNELGKKTSFLNALGMLYKTWGKLDSALIIYEQAIVLSEKYGNPETIASILGNIGNIYQNKDDFKTALSYHKASLDTAKKYNVKKSIAIQQANTGYDLYKLGLFNEAKLLLEEAYKLCTELKMLTITQEILGYLSEVYFATGDLHKAYLTEQEYNNLTDSINNETKINEIENLKILHKTEKKEHENQTLKQEALSKELSIKIKNIVIITVSLLAILALILFFIILINRKKLSLRNAEILNQKEEIEMQSEELKNSLEQITELSDFKDEITQMLVHDLKNPLNVLLNIPESISLQEKEEIRKSSEYQIFNLVMNILDVKKYEEAELITYPKKISISKICKKIISLQNYTIKQKIITVVNQTAYENFVKADEDLTERILSNLFLNALKYTPNNGQINISCEKINNSFTKIKITDNGKGIEEKELSNIFEKYQQTGTKIKYSTGLGLTFCKIAVEKHGGKIGIESDKEKGTTVWFTLPGISSESKIPKEIIENIKIELLPKEKKILLEFLPQLEKIDISEITTFRKIFKIIEAENLGNKEWREALKNSVYACNDEYYSNLINLIKK